MNVFPLQNANSSVISVTGTAAYILPMIDTAGSVSHAFPQNLDALDITPENGDIRIMIDPSTAGLAPTASKGFLIKQGATLMLRHTNVRQIKAIATSGTVSCSLQVGLSKGDETTVISGGGGAITSIVPGTGATSLGKAEDAATASGDTGVAMLVRRRDTPQASAGTEGDYQFADGTGNGGVWVELASLISGENQTSNLIHTGPKFVNSSTGKPTSTTNLSFTTATISSNPVLLVGARIVNTTASPRYLFLNNATSIAGAAAPSVAPVLIPASGAYNLTAEELGKLGEMFTTALTIGNSSMAATFTAGSAGDLLVTVYWTTATS